MKPQELRKRRTEVNFDKHVLTEKKTDDLYIIKFAKPDTSCDSITFINTNNIMAVTGDYGNWIFCREFHPSPDGYVSDGYWCEKIRIASTQETSNYDPNATREEIERLIKDEELDQSEKEYLNDLLSYVDESEERYLVYAHDHLPNNRDHEFVPHMKSLNSWLEVIFDAFDEICRRKNDEKNIRPV